MLNKTFLLNYLVCHCEMLLIFLLPVLTVNSKVLFLDLDLKVFSFQYQISGPCPLESETPKSGCGRCSCSGGGLLITSLPFPSVKTITCLRFQAISILACLSFPVTHHFTAWIRCVNQVGIIKSPISRVAFDFAINAGVA